MPIRESLFVVINPEHSITAARENQDDSNLEPAPNDIVIPELASTATAKFQEPKNVEWLVDSGESSSFTPFRTDFEVLDEDFACEVKIANSAPVAAIGNGLVNTTVQTKDGKAIQLKFALSCPVTNCTAGKTFPFEAFTNSEHRFFDSPFSLF